MKWKSVYGQPTSVKTVLKLLAYSAQEVNETKATKPIKSTAIGVDLCVHGALCMCGVHSCPKPHSLALIEHLFELSTL